MKGFVSKTLIAGTIAAVSLFGAGSASAATTFNQFTFQPHDVGQDGYFSADKIVGGYAERITFNPDGTFNVSLRWIAGGFYAVDEDPLSPTYGSVPLVTDTGLNSRDGYQLYALYKASGTYTTSAAGKKAAFTFTAGTGSLEVWLDPSYGNKDVHPSRTVFGGAPLDGSGDWGISNNQDDILLAKGKPVIGSGNFDSTLSTCSSGSGMGINCGSFGAESTFELTTIGQTYFVSPFPFYPATYQSGQLNNFTVAGTQTINGSLDVVFSPTVVPEPASLSLLGLGLLGLGVMRRRKQS